MNLIFIYYCFRFILKQMSGFENNSFQVKLNYCKSSRKSRTDWSILLKMFLLLEYFTMQQTVAILIKIQQ